MPIASSYKKYYKYELSEWTQPVLTSSGLIGVDDFVSSAYKLFDGDNTTFIETKSRTNTFRFYSKNPLNISHIKLIPSSTTRIINFKLTGSNDNKTFTLIKSKSISSYGIDEDVETNKCFRYFRLTLLTSNDTSKFIELNITAKQANLIEVNEKDITDFGIKYYKNITKTHYWKESLTEKDIRYYCYVDREWVGESVRYIYLKTPLGLDKNIYGTVYSWSSASIAKSEEDLNVIDGKFSSVNEEKNYVSVSIPINGSSYTTYYRYEDGDVEGNKIVEGSEDDYIFTTEETTTVEVNSNEDYDYTEIVDSTDFDEYIEYDTIGDIIVGDEYSSNDVICLPMKTIYYKTIFESSEAGKHKLSLQDDSIVLVTLVGGGGAAAMRGVYDDRGYGWSGASGSYYSGEFFLSAGVYDIEIASANNNTKGQGGDTNTINPSDTSTHDTKILNVITVKGGGSGYYSPNTVGIDGGNAVFEIQPLKTFVDRTGKNGASGSGGKGSGSNWTHDGGESIYMGYGKGQGCSTSEYAARRRWIAGTGGYAKIEIISNEKNYTRCEKIIL